MQSVIIDSKGDTREEEVTRRDLVQKFGIHSRDLRPVFVKKQSITLLSRANCIIFNYRSVKLVIGTKEVFVLGLEKSKISEIFIPFLGKKIQEQKEKIRFEHLILDTTLTYILEKIFRRFDDIERTSVQILGKLDIELRDQVLEQLLHLKKRLSKLETNVEELEEIIEEIVEDDEELEDLYLEVKHPANVDDIESILENALEQIEDISHRIDELDENIDDTQEILTLKLDHLRNTIIKFDLLITMATGLLAFMTVVTGLYGMNIKSGLENDHQAFLNIALVLGGAFIFGMLLLLAWLRKNKIL
ncbi:hypothetical protein K9L63_00610 [Candidatus Gracilibacteria bacterium]|nr:hypothetical protein [Candidatus Gracilibacteria bacterium]